MVQRTPTQPDTSDMVVVHRVFRREFRLLPQMVRAVPSGDTARARVVAAHCAEMVEALHHHHGGEDDLVWPLLRERAALQAPLVERMEQQHEVVASLLEQAVDLTGRWAADPRAGYGDALVEVLTQVSAALDEHLDEEERTVLPLVAQHLTVKEWGQLAERGMTSMPRNRLVVFLAHVLEDASAEERRAFLGHVPLPGRLAYRLVGRRTHRREVQALRRDLPTPPGCAVTP